MKAVQISKYGSPEVLQLNEVPKPAPKDDEVLIRIHATSVNPVDWKIRSGSLKWIIGFQFPKTLGFDVSGEVVQTGSRVTRFRVGDQVYARSNRRTGEAYAEFIAIHESTLALKPADLSHLEAAAVPLAGLTALQGLRDFGKVRAGQQVLIVGASGGVGHFAVQIARARGATVTGVASERNQQFLIDLGVHQPIDYAKTDLTQLSARFGCIYDTTGLLKPRKFMRLLEPNGTFVTTLPHPEIALGIFKLNRGKRVRMILVKPLGKDLEEMNKLIQQKQLRVVIDQIFPLERVQDAHRASESGHTRGKLVISVGHGQSSDFSRRACI
jgi:NADPH:quinone reductase-like Zn-dependent oxidoreductase